MTSTQLICIPVTLHLMASIQHPSSLLPVPLWLSVMLIGLMSMASSTGLPAPRSLSLNQGTEQGDEPHAGRGRKSPEGAVTLHNSTHVIFFPHPTAPIHQQTPPHTQVENPELGGRLGVSSASSNER